MIFTQILEKLDNLDVVVTFKKIGNEYTVCLAGTVYTQSNSGSYSDIFKNLFQGNTEKNTYIEKNKTTNNDEIINLCRLLIFFKDQTDSI